MSDEVDVPVVPIEKFVLFERTTGRVWSAGTTQMPSRMVTDLLDVLVGDSANANPGKSYVQGGQVIDISPPPSSHHHFDYTLKQWVDPRTLQDHKDAKWVAIKKARSEATSAPLLTTSFGVFDADEEAMGNIKGTIAGLNEAAALGGGPPPSVTWTLANNTSVTLTRRQLSELAVALLQRGNAAHETARTLRTQISAATTAAEVEAVTWPTT